MYFFLFLSQHITITMEDTMLCVSRGLQSVLVIWFYKYEHALSRRKAQATQIFQNNSLYPGCPSKCKHFGFKTDVAACS